MNCVKLNLILIGIKVLLSQVSSAFIISQQQRTTLEKKNAGKKGSSMSFAADGSKFSSKDSDHESEDDNGTRNQGSRAAGFRPLAMDEPVIEESPVPFSKISANRFIVFYCGVDIGEFQRDSMMESHEDHVSCAEDHAMNLRKAKLHNETFTYDAVTNVVWSFPLSSTDLKRHADHAMCLDAMCLEGVQEFLSREPSM